MTYASTPTYPANAIALVRASGAEPADFVIRYQSGPMDHAGGDLPYLEALTDRGWDVKRAVGDLWCEAQLEMIDAGDGDWTRLPTNSRVIADALGIPMEHDLSDGGYAAAIAAGTADLRPVAECVA